MGDYRTAATKQRHPSVKYEQAYFMSAPDVVLGYKAEKYHTDDQFAADNQDNELPNEGLESWIILLAVFSYNVVMGYHYMCFGMYYVGFTETFETSKAKAGFIGAIHSSMGSLCSIFASVFIDIIGMRSVTLIGCSLAAIGIFSSAFAQNIYTLYITYGVITGVGLSFSGLTSQLAIQKNFNKHRNMATSISVCGLPLGNIISPIITNYFLKTFGWRGTLAIHSAILLNTVAFAMTFSNVKSQNTTETKKEDSDMDKNSKFSNFCRVLFDFSVLKEVVFIPMILFIMLARLNIGIFFDHTPSRSVYLGTSLSQAGYLITILCIGSLIGRTTCSILSAFVKFNPLLLLSGVTLLQGVAALLVPSCMTYIAIAGCCLFFGLMQGFVVPMIMLVIVKVAGVEKYAKARAILNIFGSLSSFTATPLAGWMFDVTQNYDIPFYFAGFMGIMSSVFVFIVFVINKVQVSKRKQNRTFAIQRTQDAVKALETLPPRIRTFTF